MRQRMLNTVTVLPNAAVADMPVGAKEIADDTHQCRRRHRKRRLAANRQALQCPKCPPATPTAAKAASLFRRVPACKTPAVKNAHCQAAGHIAQRHKTWLLNPREGCLSEGNLNNKPANPITGLITDTQIYRRTIKPPQSMSQAVPQACHHSVCHQMSHIKRSSVYVAVPRYATDGHMLDMLSRQQLFIQMICLIACPWSHRPIVRVTTGPAQNRRKCLMRFYEALLFIPDMHDALRYAPLIRDALL